MMGSPRDGRVCMCMLFVGAYSFVLSACALYDRLVVGRVVCSALYVCCMRFVSFVCICMCCASFVCVVVICVLCERGCVCVWLLELCT